MRYAPALVSLLCSVSLWSAVAPDHAAAQVVSGQGQPWPPEELDFPHTLFTDKAFPENEVGLVPSFLAEKTRTREWLTTFSFEQRLGARGDWGVTLPYHIKARRDGTTTDGLGELGLSYKQVLWVHQDTVISSASLEMALPSGGRDRAWHCQLAGHPHCVPKLLYGHTSAKQPLQEPPLSCGNHQPRGLAVLPVLLELSRC